MSAGRLLQKLVRFCKKVLSESKLRFVKLTYAFYADFDWYCWLFEVVLHYLNIDGQNKWKLCQDMTVDSVGKKLRWKLRQIQGCSDKK
jgi:hypothetical protein